MDWRKDFREIPKVSEIWENLSAIKGEREANCAVQLATAISNLQIIEGAIDERFPGHSEALEMMFQAPFNNIMIVAVRGLGIESATMQVLTEELIKYTIQAKGERE